MDASQHLHKNTPPPVFSNTTYLQPPLLLALTPALAAQLLEDRRDLCCRRRGEEAVNHIRPTRGLSGPHTRPQMSPPSIRDQEESRVPSDGQCHQTFRSRPQRLRVGLQHARHAQALRRGEETPSGTSHEQQSPVGGALLGSSLISDTRGAAQPTIQEKP